MNDALRKKLKEAYEKINEACAILEEVKAEEEEKLETMPDSLKEGEKGEKMQGGIDALSEAVDYLENAGHQIDTASE